MINTTQITLSNTNANTATIDTGLFPLNARLGYTYRYEALPLEYLVVNETRVTTQKCNASSATWLNCLQTSGLSIVLNRCIANQELRLAYDFEDPEGFLGTKVTKRNFTVSLNFRCELSFKNLILLTRHSFLANFQELGKAKDFVILVKKLKVLSFVFHLLFF